MENPENQLTGIGSNGTDVTETFFQSGLTDCWLGTNKHVYAWGEKNEAEDSSGGGDMMKINILILNGHMQLERMFETRHFAAFKKINK